MAQEAQVDFSGGENSTGDKILVEPNAVALGKNLLLRRGGGLTARKGFKDLGAGYHTGPGRAVFEIDQSVPTVLTFDNSGAGFQYFEEQMQPRFRIFEANPITGCWVRIGAREKFTQLSLNVIYPYTVAGNTFLWRVSNGAGGYIDKTASITETVANSKQMRGAAGLWTFSWPDFSDWLPQQAETRQYQYWLEIFCNLGGTNGGSDVVHGQRFVRGNMLGRRIIVAAADNGLSEWPGFTLTRVSIEGFPGGIKVKRTRGAVMNDYFYYASDAQRPLRIFNGARGATRAGGNNSPVDAGLSAPSAVTNGGVAINAAAYPNGYVIRARVAALFGVEGRRGEGPPSASVEVTVAAAPAGQITWSLANAITWAAMRDVHGLLLYVTDDLSGTPGSLRDDPSNFYRIATIVRDDATWNAGTYVDAYAPRTKSAPTPISYDTTPPFYPKFVTKGGERLWIADDFRVACSDPGRADSFDPANIWLFPQVTGIIWRRDRMLVFESENIQQVRGINQGLPIVDYFYRALGCVQPDSITMADGDVLFMSRLGPARIYADDSVGRIAKKRTWESSNFWNSIAGERDLAQGAFFDRRWWLPIDSGGPLQYVGRTATYDLEGTSPGPWFWERYAETGALERVWGSLTVIHAPLDHALARQLVLVGFPDQNGTTLARNLYLLEYGTTDNWGAAQTDGQLITAEITTRGLTMTALEQWKQFTQAHLRYKMPSAGRAAFQAMLLSDIGTAVSKIVTESAGSAFIRELKFEPTDAGGGSYREVAPQLYLAADTDSGFDLYSWFLNADLEGWNLK